MLTKRQNDVLKYIKKYTAAHGFPPTIREICKGLDLSSTATVFVHIKNLESNKIDITDMNHDNNINVTDLSLLVKEVEKNKDFIEISDINYTEILDNIENPERGFYTPVSLNLKPTNNISIAPKGNLIHLRNHMQVN